MRNHHLRTRFLFVLAAAEVLLILMVILFFLLIAAVFLFRLPMRPPAVHGILTAFFGEEQLALLPWMLALWVFLSLAAAAVIIAVLLLRLNRKVTRPIEDLTAATEKICAGEYDVEIIGSEEREIDDLCRSLDAMRLRLKERSLREQAILEDRHRLIANISHDMRTPVTTIKGYVQAIEDGVASTPEQIENCFRHIRAKAEFLEYLAEDMTEYSDHESGRMRYNFEDVELRAFLGDMAEEYRDETESGGFVFSLSLPEEDVMVRADRRRLQRVMQNLLSNAIKYNRPGGSVGVALEAKGPYAYICVSDSGVGIPAASLKKVFDSFYREDSSRGGVSGHGLGLAIAKQIVEAHHGKIWMQSREGEGSMAFLCLPLKRGRKE